MNSPLQLVWFLENLVDIYPVINYIKSRMASFWAKLIQKDLHHTANIMYSLIFNMQSRQDYRSEWLYAIQKIITDSGFNRFWILQSCVRSISRLKTKLKQRLDDQFFQSWFSTIESSTTCINYRIFKKKFGLEIYLITLPKKHAVNLTKFRLANTHLPVVTGRYTNISYDERLCTLCEQGKIGDKFHALFECSFFNDVREELLPRYYYKNPNTFKMEKLFNTVKKK